MVVRTKARGRAGGFSRAPTAAIAPCSPPSEPWAWDLEAWGDWGKLSAADRPLTSPLPACAVRGLLRERRGFTSSPLNRPYSSPLPGRRLGRGEVRGRGV